MGPAPDDTPSVENTHESALVAAFDGLLAESSVGSPTARAIRALTPPEVMADMAARLDARRPT